MKGKTVQKAVAALAFAILAQTGVSAEDPAKELEELLEEREELSGDSLLAETLGLEELQETMEENGWTVSILGSLTDKTAETLAVPEDGYAGLILQVDPQQKKWQFTGSLGTSEPFADILLYGDEQQLALEIPQLFDGAVGLWAGSLQEQYRDSGISQLMGESLEAEDVPDVDLTFYPSGNTEPFEDIRESLEEKEEQIQKNAQVEKTEADGEDIYTMHLKAADILDFYEIALNGYVDLLEDLEPIVTVNGDLGECRELIEEMLDDLESVLEDEITLDFHVQDSLLTGLDFEMYLDLEKLDEVYGENRLKTYESGGEAETETETETETAAEETQDSVYLCFTVTPVDPANPDAGADIAMEGLDAERSRVMDMQLSIRGTRTENMEEKTIALTMGDGEGETYSGTIYHYTFDSASGELSVSFGMTDAGEDEAATFLLDGVFTEIEKGKSFTFTAERLGMEGAEETAVFETDLYVYADPGELFAPANVRYLFALDASGLMDLMNEVSGNAEKLVGEENETETETEEESNE